MFLTLFQRARFAVLRAFTLMVLDDLPSPTNTPCAYFFFPATDHNRQEVKYKLTAELPFWVHDSRDLKNILLSNGDLCSNLIITQVRYYQRIVAPLHEFMVIDYKDILQTETEVKNYIVLERWGSDFQPPNHSKKKPETHTVVQVDEINSPDDPGLLARTSLSASHVASSSSDSLSRPSIANDRFIISYRRRETDIDKLEPFGRTLLATLTPPPTSTFTVAHLVVLTACVSEDMPIYNPLESQCFYFGRVIWEVMRMGMGATTGGNIRKARNSFDAADPLQWGSQIVKGLMKNKVQSRYGAPAMKAKFDLAWLLFVNTVKERIAEHDKPLLDERRAKEEALRAKEALELEVQHLRAQVATQTSYRNL
ncbi:hypothetical protein BT96DRAFT_929586 [Gymnopus androsaceus JB14]|uniref:Uncharacterized protein n=1 Tax=Gymnopus androsaceus JB14 TaxID=1447944 RepID=A0A6A4GEE4_9AGAR|nr:hypothetical protein BT96DRAFT_929586 [Gymnopus androsaceus JB14]